MTEGYTPLAAISTKEQKRHEQVAKDNAKARENKMKAENAANVKARAYAIDKKYGYKEMGKQAASQEWRDKQARATKAHPKIVSKGYTGGDWIVNQERAKLSSVRNNEWQQIANARRANAEAIDRVANKKSASVYIPTSAAGIGYARENAKAEPGKFKGSYAVDLGVTGYAPDYKKQIAARNQSEGAARGDAQQAALAQLRKQNQNNVAAKKKAQQAYDSAAKGAANNWQQQAAYQQQKDAERNKARASAAKGAANNWQQQAARDASFATAMSKYNSDSSKTLPRFNVDQNLDSNKYWAQEDARLKRIGRDQERNSYSVETVYPTKKQQTTNAMQGDPRYESSGVIPKATKATITKNLALANIGGTSVPNYKNISKADNKQEFAQAISKNKEMARLHKETYESALASKKRNSRSDIGNAVADFKEEAKAKAKSLFKKKKKK